MCVAVDLARLNQMLDLSDRQTPRRRHHRIEVSRGLPVDEIAFRVALPSMNQRNVGDKAGLHDIGLVVELADFLALRDYRADARAGKKSRDSGSAGADALGKRPLRVEFEFEFAREIHTCENLVLADIARNHLLDLAGFKQNAEADPVDAGVVGNEGQILRARFAHRVDQRLGNPANAKSAGHQHHAVLDLAGERLVRGWRRLFSWAEEFLSKDRSVPSRPTRALQDASRSIPAAGECAPVRDGRPLRASRRYGLMEFFRRDTRPTLSPARYIP